MTAVSPTVEGKENIQSPLVNAATWGLYSDASRVGMGGVYLDRWFSVAWPSSFSEKHINVLELFAITTAIFTWGGHWRDQDIVIYTDNKPITDICLTGATKNKDIMSLLRHIFYFLAQRNTNVRLEHVYGYNNSRADSLSRLQVHHFKELTPAARQRPDDPPDMIWTLFASSETATSPPP